MNVEIGAEALFPEKEYISGIFVAVHMPLWEGQGGNCQEHIRPWHAQILRNTTYIGENTISKVCRAGSHFQQPKLQII
jgi:hypothetical protein